MAVLGAFIVLVGMIVVLSAIFALPVEWLVNAIFTPELIRSVFGSTQIGFMKAWQLSLLCGFLFKNTTSADSK